MSGTARSPEPLEPPLDPAFVALLADPRIALRRPPEDVPADIVRAAANRFLARAPRPPVHAVEELVVEGPAGPRAGRLYRASAERCLPVTMFFHGGGFLLGSLETHDAMCRTLANATAGAVCAIDYRLAPEHPFPAAIDDCVAACAWLRANAEARGLDPARMAFAGDSAGGQLAVAAALGTPSLRHLGLLYPLIDPSRSSRSQRRFDEGYMLTGSFLDWAWAAYGASAGARDDYRFDLARASVAGLPPTTIVTAAFDPLRDEGEALADRLAAAGVAAELRRYPGMIHGFAGLPQLTPLADDAIAWMGQRIAAAFA